MSSSASTPNHWSPYYTYKDCSQGICSIHCPQWCYLIFPHPPPLGIDDEDGDSASDFSPLIIALICILASAFILVSYYIISKYCKRRQNNNINNSTSSSLDRDQFNESSRIHEGWQSGNNNNNNNNNNSEGLDEGLIKSITVCKYKKGEGLLDEGCLDCSVCLSSFQENESLRLLPKCNHAFHVPCIDTWLKSHTSCPLCRANIAPTAVEAAVVVEVINNNPRINQQRNGAISVVHQDLEEQEGVTNIDMGNLQESVGGENGSSSSRSMMEPGPLMRRSVSMSSRLFQGQVLSIADILRISEENEDHLQYYSSMGIIGSSKQFVDDNINNGGEYYNNCKSDYRNGVFNLVRRPLTMKRSISTGRFTFPRYEKERNHILPN